MTKAIRWSPERLAEHQKRTEELRARVISQPIDAAQKWSEAVVKATKPTGQQRMQALGRLRDGQMNKTETRYAAHLDSEKHAGRVAWYMFEGIKLKLAPNTGITIDFAVMLADGRLQMHDVKGSRAIYTDDARAKTKIAAAMFPFAFFIAYPSKTSSTGWDIEEV